MRFLFVVTFVAVGVYLLGSRRRFDLYSVAYGAAGLYFLPGFFGYALLPATLRSSVRLPLELSAQSYTVMILVLTAIGAGAVLYDRVPSMAPLRRRMPAGGVAAWVALGLALAGFLATLAISGDTLLSHSKRAVMDTLGRPYLLWVFGATLAAVLAFAQRRRRLCAAALALLVVDLAVGFRSSMAVTILALLVLWGQQVGPQRFFKRQRRLIVVGCLAVAALFVYKFLFIPIKKGDWEEVSNRLSSPEFYLQTVSESEPFLTQAILDRVLTEEFRVGAEHLWQVSYQFVLFAPSLGAKIQTFHDHYQPVLFPEARGGLASNIWAEAWSVGGWGFLVLFLCSFAVVLGLGSWLLRAADPKLRALAALAGAYWAFYIHRNDLATILNLEKRVIALWAMAVLGALVVAGLRRAATPTPAELQAGEG